MAQKYTTDQESTLQNTELLAKWLRASYHSSDHRPVPIEEYLVYENSIYPSAQSKEFFQTATKRDPASILPASLEPYRLIDASPFKQLANPTVNAMVALAVETATAGFGALVFCGSRHACQSNAMLISDAMQPPSAPDAEILEKRLDLVADLQSLPCGLDPVLQVTVPRGVAFHREHLQIVIAEIVMSRLTLGYRCWAD
jgi:DNA polymerase theta